MAKQKGIIKLDGTIGGITFYKTTEDGYLAREKGGVSADKIANDPAFQRTRENGEEFGRAGKAGKLLRNSIRAMLQNASDSRMVGRLTQKMVEVTQEDITNPRGQRNVIDGEAELLEGFEFNISGKLGTTLYAPFTGTIDRVAGTLTANIPAFVPINMLAAQVVLPIQNCFCRYRVGLKMKLCNGCTAPCYKDATATAVINLANMFSNGTPFIPCIRN